MNKMSAEIILPKIFRFSCCYSSMLLTSTYYIQLELNKARPWLEIQ